MAVVEERKCPECGATTMVVTVGISDHTRCPNGHNLVWTKEKDLQVDNYDYGRGS